MHRTNATVIAVLAISAAATYAAAQSKAPLPQTPKAAPSAPATEPSPKPGEHPHAAHGMGMCPMHEAHDLATFSVEETPQGAIVRITAKRSEDVTRTRELARKLIDMCEAGCQGMHKGHAERHGMHH